MTARNQILKTITSKHKGQSIHVKTLEFSYWGCFYEYRDELIILKPYYTNKEEQLPLHNEQRELSIDQIIDVD
jgi:hypothetical protein